MKKSLFTTLIGFGFFFIAGCKHESSKKISPETDDNFPPEISKIIVSKCATAGCHNSLSYKISGGGLLLDSWEHLFDGGNTGAAVVAYSAESSPIMFFTNSFTDLGLLPPDNMKMPLNSPSLSREEYLTLKTWIEKGAPDKNGNIPFASNPETRQKIYLAHAGCDFITVIDAEKNVIMRSVQGGKERTIEVAYSVKTSGDDYAYISYWASQYMQKLDMKKDSIVVDIDLGAPNSNILFTTANSNDILLTNLYRSSLLRIDPSTKTVTATYGNGSFNAPHGIAANRSFDTFYVTEQYGNTVYKISASGIIKKISIDGNPLSLAANGPNPYNIKMSPDYSKYFLTCQGSNEVRVMDAYEDKLIRIIPVGISPQELVLSASKPYLFVSCSEDSATIPLFKGSVYIIDYNTYTVVKKINDRYYMPHALTVDDKSNKLFVFSRNIDPNGPVPHHNSATCGGRNGYYSVYDFNTLQPVNNKRYEVIVDPFAADIRFKN